MDLIIDETIIRDGINWCQLIPERIGVRLYRSHIIKEQVTSQIKRVK